jgi:hypothetical protein
VASAPLSCALCALGDCVRVELWCFVSGRVDAAVYEPARQLCKVSLHWYPGEADAKGPHELEMKIFAGVQKVASPVSVTAYPLLPLHFQPAYATGSLSVCATTRSRPHP